MKGAAIPTCSERHQPIGACTCGPLRLHQRLRAAALDQETKEPQQTTEYEYAVIGEADLDTVPIRRVGWEAPNRFDKLESAQDYLAEVQRTDRDAINPRIQKRTVGDWEDIS